MRKLTIIPGLLFGLIFAGGGFFFLSETSIPTWRSWYAMQDWRPGYAILLSVSGSENDTRASYRYDFGGQTYQGDRVYVAEFKDNIGSYHADLLQQLRSYYQNGQNLPVWVNPLSPNEAVLDRNMRWGLFVLMTVFCSIFIFIGLAVIYGSIKGANKPGKSSTLPLLELRREWKEKCKDPNFSHSFLEFCQYRYEELQQPDDVDISHVDWQSRKGWETARIASNAAKGAWFFWIFALLWNAISSPIIFIIPGRNKKW